MGSELPEADTTAFDRERRRREENRPLEEAGEGESEGFELAEQELIENASHGDEHGTTRILRHARTDAVEEEAPDEERYGEPDHEDREDDGDR
ncbi:MAG: hypothetical protein WC558_12455 [Patulibacter sp.]